MLGIVIARIVRDNDVTAEFARTISAHRAGPMQAFLGMPVAPLQPLDGPPAYEYVGRRSVWHDEAPPVPALPMTDAEREDIDAALLGLIRTP